jgi:hypothetical protein
VNGYKLRCSKTPGIDHTERLANGKKERPRVTLVGEMALSIPSDTEREVVMISSTFVLFLAE